MAPDESLWRADETAQASRPGCSTATCGATRGQPDCRHPAFTSCATRLRRDAGQSIEEVSRFLDHSSLAVTSVYLRRIEVVEDNGWSSFAEAIGI